MDPDGQWLDFKVFIYAGGRTTRWCGEPTAGPRIAVSGPGGGAVITRPWMGLIGDETALPMIARMLEAAPRDTMGEAVAFIPDAADAQPMRVPPGVRLRWALRGSGATPLAALRALSIPADERFVFLAGERGEAKAARN